MARPRQQLPGVLDGTYGKAEALGEIKTMPEANNDALPEVEKEPTVDNPEEFRMAIGHAQMEGRDYVEVTEKLFKYLLKNAKSKYITYGDPGIKVFLAGTKDKILREESMSADAYHSMITNDLIKARDAGVV